MKVIVTGGDGYLGSVLVDLLLSNGQQVTVVDNGRRGLPLPRNPIDGLSHVDADIRTIDWAEVIAPGDAVVHLAALVGDPCCARNTDEAEAVNYAASVRLIEAMTETGAAHLVFASTCSNYGSQTESGVVVDEDSDLQPISHYARTKVRIEQRLLEHAHPFSVDVLRFATLFGSSPSMRFDLTVNEFTRDLMLGRPLEVYAPASWRPYVHTTDASQAIYESLLRPASEPRVLNVGSDKNNSTKRDIVHTVNDTLDTPGNVSYRDHGDDGRDYQVNFSRMRDVLQFEPSVSIETGVSEIIAALHAQEYGDPFADYLVVS